MTGKLVSDHFDGRRFFNPTGANGQPFWKVPALSLAMLRSTPWPKSVPVNARRPPAVAHDEIAVTFIGHASFLIQAGAQSLITDPVYAVRASPVRFAGPRRVRLPGIALDDLPPVTVVLLSHNHYDHCDLHALAELERRFQPTFVTLTGNSRLLRSTGIQRIVELDWWEVSTGPSLQVTATPAQHFSARSPFDRNRALWGGFVIDVLDRRIYFAGDSGYGPHFTEIGRRFGPMDLSLIPIGAYEPRWFMKDIHMNPAEAVQAHLDVGSLQSIGMHYGTFQLTTEGIDAPVEDLRRALAGRGMASASFRTIEVGETYRLR